MEELDLFLYAYDKEGELIDDISDEITCDILDQYILDHDKKFYSIETKKTYLKEAKELAAELVNFLKTTDYGTALAKHSEVFSVTLTVEYVDGPYIKEWIVWDRNKKNLTIK